jgi:hypothetical protein
LAPRISLGMVVLDRMLFSFLLRGLRFDRFQFPFLSSDADHSGTRTYG